MTEETRKHFILGGGLIVATIAGIIVYKKFQAGSQANQAANDQATQDELAYLASMSLSSPYATGSVASGITAPAPPAMPSITDELSAIEQAFGLAPASSPAAGSSPTSTPAKATPSAPSGSTPTSRTAAMITFPSAAVNEHILASELPYLREEGVAVA